LFGSNKNYYKESVKVLADEGYTDKYLSVLKNELAAAKGSKPLAEGKSYLANAYLFRGELAKAYETFQTADLKKLNDIIAAILINNMIFCLFVQDKLKQATSFLWSITVLFFMSIRHLCVVLLLFTSILTKDTKTL
jgi:hypothetical protein